MNISFNPVAEDKPDVAWPKEDDESFQDFCTRTLQENGFTSASVHSRDGQIVEVKGVPSQAIHGVIHAGEAKGMKIGMEENFLIRISE